MLNEELLNAWLQLSFRLKGNRFLDTLSYNEMVICRNLKASSTPLTASDLVQVMHLHKSQMNQILTGLEEKGVIERRVDEKDKRKVLLFLKKESMYEVDHQEILELIDGLIEEMGIEKVEELKNSLLLADQLLEKRTKE